MKATGKGGRWRRITLRVGLALGSFLAGLFMLELFLAAFRPVPPSIEQNMYFEPDPVTGFRIKPLSEGHFGTIPANANEHGHRDEAASLEKPAEVFRVLSLGDSFTVGSGVGQEEAYPEVLERLLNETGGGQVEVINSGVGGWGPYQYAQYYEQRGSRFDPDLILVGFFIGNDAYDSRFQVSDLYTAVLGRRVQRSAAENPLIGLKVFFFERSHLVRLLANKAPMESDLYRADCGEFSDFLLRIERQRIPNHLKARVDKDPLLARNVAEIVRIRDQASPVPVVVALIPDELQVNPALRQTLMPNVKPGRFDFDQPQRALVDLLQAAGIEVIDLLPAFRSDERCLFLEDTHWNAEGHELAAAMLAQALHERFPAPPKVPR